MKLQLNEFADSGSGLVLSRREAPAGSQGALEYRLITLSSISPDGTIDTKEVGRFYASKPITTATHLTQPWDVVVRLTPPYTAALVEPSQAGFVVPSNCVLVRIRDGRVAPEYLRYALNSDAVRRRWERNASGSVLATIRPTQIAALELEIPTLEQQAKIVKFVAAAREECAALRALADEKEKYYAALVEKKLDDVAKAGAKSKKTTAASEVAAEISRRYSEILQEELKNWPEAFWESDGASSPERREEALRRLEKIPNLSDLVDELLKTKKRKASEERKSQKKNKGRSAKKNRDDDAEDGE